MSVIELENVLENLSLEQLDALQAMIELRRRKAQLMGLNAGFEALREGLTPEQLQMLTETLTEKSVKHENWRIL